jgi:hypothetical protein
MKEGWLLKDSRHYRISRFAPGWSKESVNPEQARTE